MLGAGPTKYGRPRSDRFSSYLSEQQVVLRVNVNRSSQRLTIRPKFLRTIEQRRGSSFLWWPAVPHDSYQIDETRGAQTVAPHPPLSVIVIPLIGNSALANCLDRLPLANVECIVVLRGTMGAVASWERRYPSVTFLGAADAPVPVRRQMGLRAAAGNVVGLIEDTTWPDEGWCPAILSAFSNPRTAAAGGSVRIAATLPSRYQALGASEYGAFATNHLPRAAKCDTICDQPVAAWRVPGNNMAFRRLDLIEVIDERDGGMFEGLTCARLLAKGHQVVYQPRMVATYAVCDRHNASLATRLHHGRIYAAEHVRGRAWPSRLTHLAKTPLLPIVLTTRAISSLHGSGDLCARMAALFWVVLMESAWALGEAIGVLAGAGKSVNEWR